MEKAVSLRMAVAERLAAAYSVHPGVRAIVLAGSVGGGIADKHSDIELDLFWESAPSDDERASPPRNLAINVVELHPLEDNEWSEVLDCEMLRIDVSNFLLVTVEECLNEVVVSGSTDLSKQMLVSHLLEGSCLVDKDSRAPEWKMRASAYPEHLARAMVGAHLAPGNMWLQRHALLERGDSLCLHRLKLETVMNLLGALSGLNRRYIAHPSFKWLPRWIEMLANSPPDLDFRIKSVLESNHPGAILELESLALECCDLIETELPGSGAHEARGLFCRSRPSLGEKDLDQILEHLKPASKD